MSRQRARNSGTGSAIAVGILFGIFLVLLQEARLGHRIASEYAQMAAVPGLVQQLPAPQENNTNLTPDIQAPLGSDTEDDATSDAPAQNEPEELEPPETGNPARYQYSKQGEAIITTDDGEFVLDFTKLKEENPDFVGWLHFPNLDISYPMVQGSDNSRYLKYTFAGIYSGIGAIFVDYRNQMLQDKHTIVYGHNFHDYGIMFSKLVNYAKQDFYEQHPIAYIFTEEGGYTLEIFSAYEVEVTDPIYTLVLEDEVVFADLIDHVRYKSAIESPAKPAANERILTFSTCSNISSEGRFVVVCRVVPFTRPPVINERVRAFP